MKKLIAGNWKMHGDRLSSLSLATGIRDALNDSKHDILIAPPFPYLAQVNDVVKDGTIILAAQDCSDQEQGARTGDISADMLVDNGCKTVILGHSERRQHHQESNTLVKAKAAKALEQNLSVIVCVGETDAQRDSGEAEAVVKEQVLESLPAAATAENTIIAYEPVWAIGTGKTASLKDIEQMHVFLKETLASKGDFRILYGGSVKPDNAKEILSLPFVDGALIGGASLKVESFVAIAKAI